MLISHGSRDAFTSFFITKDMWDAVYGFIIDGLGGEG